VLPGDFFGDDSGAVGRQVDLAKVVQDRKAEFGAEEGGELGPADAAAGVEQLSQRGAAEVGFGERPGDLFLGDRPLLDEEFADPLDFTGWHIKWDYRSPGGIIKFTSGNSRRIR